MEVEKGPWRVIVRVQESIRPDQRTHVHPSRLYAVSRLKAVLWHKMFGPWVTASARLVAQRGIKSLGRLLTTGAQTRLISAPVTSCVKARHRRTRRTVCAEIYGWRVQTCAGLYMARTPEWFISGPCAGPHTPSKTAQDAASLRDRKTQWREPEVFSLSEKTNKKFRSLYLGPKSHDSAANRQIDVKPVVKACGNIVVDWYALDVGQGELTFAQLYEGLVAASMMKASREQGQQEWMFPAYAGTGSTQQCSNNNTARLKSGVMKTMLPLVCWNCGEEETLPILAEKTQLHTRQ
ncbi:hypothetical protein Bbelb_099170 [Branchiostoma belcheri]|nr:hypothetical protein Bbelb_099170 [Branchiostoma belcheri]